MHVFIWQNVRDITDHYHDNGGVVVIAQDLVAARGELGRLLVLKKLLVYFCTNQIIRG